MSSYMEEGRGTRDLLVQITVPEDLTDVGDRYEAARMLSTIVDFLQGSVDFDTPQTIQDIRGIPAGVALIVGGET